MVMNFAKFRPMKSASPPQDWDYSQVKFPVLASPKVDGIRCVIHPTLGAVTNTLLPINNDYIRAYLNSAGIKYLDGELIVGNPNDPTTFNQTQSGVMSKSGTPNFTFLAFDHFESGHMCGFGIRHQDAINVVNSVLLDTRRHLQILAHIRIENVEQLLAYEEECLAKGYEGVMIRSLHGYYKFGRSTLREGGLIKMKRFVDAEAEIVGWEPLLRNQNDPEINALGLQKRGYSKDGKIADDRYVGKFHCIGINGRFKGVSFSIGSGLNDADRSEFREAIRQYELELSHGITKPDPRYPIGKTITYKYQDHGSLEAPRTPIWKGIRYA